MNTLKKFLSLLLSLMLVLGAVAVGGMSVSADGDGIVWNNAEQRYEISSYAGLKSFASIVNGTHATIPKNAAASAVLTDNIICKNNSFDTEYASDWIPIGKHIPYTGTFDGDGHVITGLTNPANYEDNAGLFVYVGADTESDSTIIGLVENVGLEGGSLTSKQYTCAGVVVINDGGTVRNCYNTGSISGNSYTGGVVGENDGGTVENCYNTGSVKNNSTFTGGVVGLNEGGTVRNCYNTGSVTGSDSFVGGVVGYNTAGIVQNCYNTGSVKCADDCFVGGVAGDNDGSVKNCYSTGSVEGVGDFVGGVAGSDNFTAECCYYDKTVCRDIGAVGLTGDTANVKGLTSEAMTGASALDNMVFAYEEGEESPWLVRETDEFYSYYPHLKGFNIDKDGNQILAENIRKTDWPARVIQPGAYRIHNYDELLEFSNIVNGQGGYTGNADPSTCAILVNNIECKHENETGYANDWTPIGNESIKYIGTFDGDGHVITGLIFHDTSAEYAGLFGFVGAGGKVRNVGLEGGEISGKKRVGGVAGVNEGSVTNCYNTSVVFGSDNVGGIVGWNRSGGTVAKCYNTGYVDAPSNGADIGGVVGWNYEGSSVSDCYNAGYVSALAYYPSVGGAVGYNNLASVTNCWYDSSTALCLSAIGINSDATSSNVGGLATVEMTGADALSNMAGFSGTDWLTMANISDESSEYHWFYPHLRGFAYDSEPALENWPPKLEKASPILSASVSEENPLPGEGSTVTLTLPEDATGTITLKVVDNVYTAPVENGTAVIEAADETPGTHEVDFYYSGEGLYKEVIQTTLAFPKYKMEPKIEFSPEEPLPGEDVKARVELYENASGIIVLTVEGNEYTKEIRDGVAKFEIGSFEEGRYTVKADYGGDDNCAAASVEETLTVRRPDSGMALTINPEEPVCGDDVTITATLPEIATGVVTLTINDNEYTMNIINGIATIIFTGFEADLYNVKAYYAGDEKFSPDTVETAFTVSKADPKGKVTAEDINYGETAVATFTLPDDATGVVTFYLDAADTGVTKDIENGQAVCEFENLEIGSHSIEAVYSGDDKYTTGDTATASFEVKSISCVLTINYVYANGGEAAKTYTGNVEIFTGYSVTSPAITGYTPDTATVTGEMDSTEGKTITVKYSATGYTATFFADGETVAEVPFTVETEKLDEPEVPAKEGYEGKWSDYTIAAGDMEITAQYTPIEYTATFTADGETVGEVKFTVETEKLDEPEVPVKEGYEGKWSEYTIAAGNMEIVAEYTPIEYTATFIADGETVAEVPFTVETEKIDEPEVPAKEGYEGEWEEYELTPGGITVNAVYTEIIPEDLCPLDNEDHGDSFFGRVRTFLHTLIWKAFRLLGLDVFFKVS